jgi:hypothetical protein
VRELLTWKLWDVGNSDPYRHGGEARRIRDGFFALSDADRAAAIAFRKTLQLLPDGAAHVLLETGLSG